MGKAKKIIIAIIIIAIIAVVGVIIRKKMISSSVVDSSKYQAVFLTNGQTYFGKVSNERSAYVSLSNVYYLILKQAIQGQGSADLNQNPTQPEYSLVKLGKELHGPTDMSISREQILFIENLSNDSKVVTAINAQK